MFFKRKEVVKTIEFNHAYEEFQNNMNILEETRRYAIKMIHDYYKYGEYENYIEMIKKKIKKGNEYID